MNIDILFENDHLLVINKPAGLVVHSDGKTDEPTVVDWILNHYPDINGVGENMHIQHKGKQIELNRPGIVHRIDRDTSGCLVIAKTQESFEHLKQLFKDREVDKTYVALVYGNIREEEGTIHQLIGRHPKDFRMWVAGEHGRGTLRDAITDYRVLGRYIDTSTKDKQGQYDRYTYVACTPHTGRTHQIRVHLKYMQHPIVADSLYAGRRTHTLGLTRMALHAQSIHVIDFGGEFIHVEAPLPDDIQTAINSLSLA
ncbi:RluA family pseudouridine synthase [Patescibacteria group bacterium]|nr:RluA family pseudouridine synthase [Patescibacteria group bacterium]